jgi:S-adenosylmethionine-diacylglycerol 3-amino-3-carboxypropyl transferase
MLAPRKRPDAMADRLEALDDEARRLHAADRAFFYSALRIERVR